MPGFKEQKSQLLQLLKNGDSIIIMNNYSITNVFKKINGTWKIIHSHESSLPPNIQKGIAEHKK
jgi:hypothetical protein